MEAKVFQGSQLARVYSKEVHGEKYLELAKTYAGKIHGRVETPDGAENYPAQPTPTAEPKPEIKCDVCSFVAKNEFGLNSHKRSHKTPDIQEPEETPAAPEETSAASEEKPAA